MADKLLFLLLILIPTQLGYHFWPQWSLVRGIRSDYLSPTLYLTDLVWGLWVIYSFKSLIPNFKKKKEKQNISIFKNNWRTYLVFFSLVVVGLNIYGAENQWIAGYRWVRILQWMISLWLMKSKSVEVREYLKIIIPIWITGEGLLSMAQVANNGSLQGVWWWLGERKFDYMTIGVALMSWWGEIKVRAYGTFSHPNSLAGFTWVTLVLRYMMDEEMVKRTRWWIVIILAIITIILCGSRTVWGVVTVTVAAFLSGLLLKQDKVRPVKMGVFGLIILTGVIVGLNSSGWDKDSWKKRSELNIAAIEMIKDNPLLGVGAGNFVEELINYRSNGILWLQPVHNIGLLGVSEIGIVGIGVLTVWVLLTIKSQVIAGKFLRRNWMMLTCLVMTGMVDHYWLTLPQNVWLMAVVAAII